MKHVHEGFSDEEFKALQKVKGKRTWREFILSLKEEKKK